MYLEGCIGTLELTKYRWDSLSFSFYSPGRCKGLKDRRLGSVPTNVVKIAHVSITEVAGILMVVLLHPHLGEDGGVASPATALEFVI